MLFHMPSAIIYIRSTSLQLIDNKSTHFTTFEFPDGTVVNKEIVDETKFDHALNNFLTANNIKPLHAIVVLADEIIISNSFPQTKGSQDQVEIKKFYDELLFDPIKVAKKELHVNGKIHLFAANRDMYQTVLEHLLSRGWRVSTVIPVSIFGLEVPGELDSQQADTILQELGKKKLHNFFDDVALRSLPALHYESGGREGVNKKPVIVILVLVLLLGAGYGIYKSGVFTGKNEMIVPVPSGPAITSTPTPEVKKAKKEDLTIKILNGTGIPGQAGTVKEALESGDFTNIETDNADTTDAADTEVALSLKVSREDQQEVKKILEALFKKVVIKEISDSKFDIIITTGK